MRITSPPPEMPAVHRNPAGIAAHDFEHHHAVVALRGGAQAVQRVGGAGDGGIEAEGEGGGFEVVVNGLGHADDGDAVFEELLRGAQRAVAAHDHQGAQAELLEIGLGLVEDFARDAVALAVAGLGGKAALVGRAQDRAADEEQRVHFLVVERPVAQRFEQALEAVEKADGVPAPFGGTLDDRPDDRVQAGTIAAAG